MCLPVNETMRSLSAVPVGNDSIDLMKFAHGGGKFAGPQSGKGRPRPRLPVHRQSCSTLPALFHSVEALELNHVLLRHQLERDPDFPVDLLALDGLDCRVDGAATLRLCVLEYGDF